MMFMLNIEIIFNLHEILFFRLFTFKMNYHPVMNFVCFRVGGLLYSVMLRRHEVVLSPVSIPWLSGVIMLDSTVLNASMLSVVMLDV